MNLTGPPPFQSSIYTLLGPAPLLGFVCSAINYSIFAGFFNILLMFVLRAALRNPWIAGGAFVMIMTFIFSIISYGAP